MAFKNTTKGFEAGRDLAIPRQIQTALSDIETVLALAVQTELIAENDRKTIKTKAVQTETFAEKYRNTINAKLKYVAASIRVYSDERKKTLTTTERGYLQLLSKNVMEFASAVLISTSARLFKVKIEILIDEIKDLF
ncbi:MAG: hypothetical protein AABX24_02850 [Nanoarchaeota archaeon]